MRKLFVSQPMNGKTNDEILFEREILIQTAEERMGEAFDVINSFIDDAPKDANALWYLGESLKLMSKADVVIFAMNWNKYRGCIIEHHAAHAYDLTILEV